MKLCIFGSGYVGLVSGTCFAEMGNQVTLVDVDSNKVAMLQRGEIPIYEPGLAELLHDNTASGRLTFTTDPAAGMAGAEVCFICVGTPMAADGHADLRYVESVARAIGRHLREFTVVVTKSTVPVGTAEKVRAWITAEAASTSGSGEVDVAVASNPEFLKEGAAIEDFMKPDRVVIGCDDPRAEHRLRELYSAFMRNGLRLFCFDIPSAEMTKYAANCMLATKISFINEIANVCERLGADVNQVRQGAGADKRIGMQFLHPGVGYGGSCFPKDVRELIRSAEDTGYQPRILQAVDAVNHDQKEVLQQKLAAWATLHNQPLAGLQVAVWGLAFKPQTDDVRESAALSLLRWLSSQGAVVRAHDPHAIPTAQAALGELPGVSYVDDPYHASEGADLLCLVTEWRPYRRPDFRRLAEQLRQRSIFDGRNQYDAARLKEFGLTIYGIGTGERLA